MTESRTARARPGRGTPPSRVTRPPLPVVPLRLPPLLVAPVTVASVTGRSRYGCSRYGCPRYRWLPLPVVRVTSLSALPVVEVREQLAEAADHRVRRRAVMRGHRGGGG